MRKWACVFLFLGFRAGACETPFTAPAAHAELELQIVALELCGEKAPLGLALFQIGDLGKALPMLTQHAGTDPRLSAAAALGHLDMGKFSDALEWATRSATGPWRAVGHYVAGRALTELGRSTDALSAYQKALDSDSTFVEARLAMATLRDRNGDVPGAWKDYQRVLAVDPKNAAVRQRSEALAKTLDRPAETLVPPQRLTKHQALEGLKDPGPLLRIGLGTDGRGRTIPRSAVEVQCAGPFRWTDPAGKTLLRGKGGEPWTVTASSVGIRLNGPGLRRVFPSSRVTMKPDRPTDSVIIRQLARGVGFTWSSFSDREVRGQLEISVAGRAVRAVNRVGLEEYLRGVVPAEMPARFPSEALKAQAVLARTYALFQRDVRRPHRRDGYDLCDEQHCQVYGGVPLENEKTNEVLEATRGLVLRYKNLPVHAVYSSHCGGASQSGGEIGWGDVPYWGSATDGEFCAPSRFVEDVKHRWVRLTWAEDVGRRLKTKKDIGPLVSIAVTARGASGRATEVTARGEKGTLVLDRESEIRRLFGLAMLRGTGFDVFPVFRAGRPAYFLVEGRGWGHGVGMCQSGAAGRAESGQDFKEILAHYFPGSALNK